MQLYSATLGMGIYFMKYVLGDEGLFGTFSWAVNIPMIAGLLLTPTLVRKFSGMYKLNLVGYTIGTLGRVGVIIAGYMGNIPLMLGFTAIAALGMSPLQGDMNALIATTSEYTRLTTGKKVDGTMYSCTSFGTKVGGGIGTAIAGWLLAASGCRYRHCRNLPSGRWFRRSERIFQCLWRISRHLGGKRRTACLRRNSA